MDFVNTGSMFLTICISKAKSSNQIVVEINDVQPHISFDQNFRKYDRISKLNVKILRELQAKKPKLELLKDS